jgi:glycosyltransferase involved in cell wall biosynthesis
MKVNRRMAILIPAYNEEKYIHRVIENCVPYSLDMIVVDDGSFDQTAMIVKNLKKSKKYPLILLEHARNKGK